MAILGTGADLASDLLILSEIVISLLVLLGVVQIRRDRRKGVGRHRGFMLWVLGLNAFFLVGFLVQDALKTETVLQRSTAPLGVFVTVLTVHLMIAVSALSVAIVSWRIAAKGAFRTPEGAWDLPPDVRVRHRRVSRFYPWLWGATLVTGLLLYSVLYILY